MRSPTLQELPAPPRGKKGWPWTEESPRLPVAMPDGKPWPKISIITPSYNQVEFIEETIRSVLLQGYPELEYIIVDGGSVDGSVDIIKKYEKWLTYWVTESDKGQSDAINKGFGKTSGKIHAWLNSDDCLLRNALDTAAMAYQASPTAGAWCGGCIQVNSNDKIVATHWPKRLDAEGIAKWTENSFGQSSCFFSAEAWHECGPLDQDLHYAMDFDLWLKIAKLFRIERVNYALSAFHAHKDAKTHKDPGQMFAEIYVVQIRHGYEHFAREGISQWVNDYSKMTRMFDLIFRFPILRPVKPIVAILLRIIPRHQENC